MAPARVGVSAERSVALRDCDGDFCMVQIMGAVLGQAEPSMLGTPPEPSVGASQNTLIGPTALYV